MDRKIRLFLCCLMKVAGSLLAGPDLGQPGVFLAAALVHLGAACLKAAAHRHLQQIEWAARDPLQHGLGPLQGGKELPRPRV